MPILRKAGKGTGFDHHAAEQQPVQDIVFRVFQELRFLLRVEPRQTVQQHLQNFQLVVQKARRIVTVNAIAGEKAVNRAVQTLFSVVQEEAEAQQLRENERLCFSVLSNYARVLRRWKVQYAAKAPDKRFVEACHKLDEAEYYLDILCAGDSHERAEVVSYLLVDGRLDKLKETINGRDAARTRSMPGWIFQHGSMARMSMRQLFAGSFYRKTSSSMRTKHFYFLYFEGVNP